MSWRALLVMLAVVVTSVGGPAVPSAASAAPAPAGPRPVLAVDDPAEPSTSTTWALRPATDEAPDGRISLRHVIEGGAEAGDLLALTNFSDRPATFAVYASDGTVSPDGNFDVLPSDEPPVGGGAWITVGPVEGSTARAEGGVVLEVGAGATVLVPLLISVPANATPGDHPAGVVAELVQGGGGVQVSSRVGVRVHLRVAGDVVAALVPEAVTATYTPSWNPFSGGTVTVTVAVANTGNVRLGAETVASVEGPGGLASTRATSTQREVLPGQAAETTLEIPVAPLFYTWGDVVVHPAVVGEDDVTAALTAGTASFTVWTVPWSQLVLLLLVVGLILLVRVSRRRNAARVQAKIDAAVAAATAATAGTVTAEAASGHDDDSSTPVRSAHTPSAEVTSRGE